MRLLPSLNAIFNVVSCSLHNHPASLPLLTPHIFCSAFPQHLLSIILWCSIIGISKKYFRPGGIALSEWTRSARAIRDTAMEHKSAAGVNTAHWVAYCPLISVLPFHFALSLSYFNWTVWSCGQLWAYVRMGSLGTLLHRDWNAMGDVAKNLSSHSFYLRTQYNSLFTT
jgi:hypothetical protein